MNAYFDMSFSHRKRLCRICGGDIPAGVESLRLNGILTSAYGKDVPLHFHVQCMVKEPIMSHLMMIFKNNK